MYLLVDTHIPIRFIHKQTALIKGAERGPPIPQCNYCGKSISAHTLVQ